MITFEHIIGDVLEHEGGYVNDPYDKGGETNFYLLTGNRKTIDNKWIKKYNSRDMFLFYKQ